MTEAEKDRYNELIAKEYHGEQLDDREALEFARLERLSIKRRRRIAEAVAASPMAFLAEVTRCE